MESRCKSLCIIVFASIFLGSCASVKTGETNVIVVKTVEDLIKAIGEGFSEIKIDAKELVIPNTITLSSNLTLDGNNAIIRYDPSKSYNVFVSQNRSNVTIKNLRIELKERVLLKGHNQGYYPFKILNTTGLKFKNVSFRNNLNTCISFYDCSDVEIDSCKFLDLGRKSSGNVYSYEGVFIGAYNKGTNGVVISNCIFESIGMDDEIVYINDGDGIQTHSETSTIQNVTIRNCTFEKISRRGIKIQTGSNFLIEDNVFENNKTAIGIAMDKDTKDIKIRNNRVQNCKMGIYTNSYVENPCICYGLEVVENSFTNMNSIFRTSGGSSLVKANISKNYVSQLEHFFFEGKISDSNVSENTFINMQLKPYQRIKAGIYIWNGSENNLIAKNVFQQKIVDGFEIYVYPKTSNNTFLKNTASNKNEYARIKDDSKKGIIQN